MPPKRSKHHNSSGLGHTLLAAHKKHIYSRRVAGLANENYEAPKETRMESIIDQENLVEVIEHVKEEEEGIAAQAKAMDKLEFFAIPKRPAWTTEQTAQQVDAQERASFLAWRQRIASWEHTDGITVTPFEKNLDIWRQLWRVVERSDVLVQIVDARNPLLYYSRDLTEYVMSLSTPEKPKKVILLLNKADFVPEDIRAEWATFLQSQGIEFVFFSALKEQESLDEITKMKRELEELTGEQRESSEAKFLRVLSFTAPPLSTITVYSSDELIRSLLNLAASTMAATTVSSDGTVMLDARYRATFGFVGYPNVGKSSTINVLCRKKRVAVSLTPGKTKHFQTLPLTEQITLCDCPGLVFPNITSNTADLVINGVLNVDKMKMSMVNPIAIISQRIPSEVLYSIYRVRGDVDLALEYAQARGFTNSSGLPDGSKSTRIIVKDYVTGKLLYCHRPNGTGVCCNDISVSQAAEALQSASVRRPLGDAPSILGGAAHSKGKYKDDDFRRATHKLNV